MAEPPAGLRERLDALRARYKAELPGRIDGAKVLWAAVRDGANVGSGLSQLYRAVHNLAGSGATFGYSDLSQAAQTLDELLQPLADAGTPPSKDQAEQIEALLNQIEAASTDREETSSFANGFASKVQEEDGEILVFLVEDDAEQAQALAMEIAHFGYRVKTYAGIFALDEAIADQRPAVVIMDMIFREGRLAGTETVARLRQRIDPHVPVVFTSVRGDFEARLNAVRAGADAYFPKPVEISELVELLDVLTGRSVPEPYRILVVEDDATMADYYASLLEQAGMTTNVLGDPMQVMERIVEFSPDLILTDLYMPGCNGFDLARVIRQQNAYAAMPLVFLSSERREDQQISAMSLGGDAFLTKPVGASQLVASVVSRAERSRVLRSMMVRDGLTGLVNHSHLKEQLAIEVDRAQRTGASLAFAMLDIDHFKAVNDTYGHPTGDRVIKSLSRVLTRRLRKTDAVGRYGGEEFAAILVNTSGERAKTIIDDIRDRFSALHHRHEDAEFTVTFSCGIAEYPGCASTELLGETADAALYEAKHAGRNCVVLAGENNTP